MTLLDEIQEQPDAAARFLDRRLDDVHAIAATILRRDPSFVLVAARGTSDHAAIYAQYAFGLRNGIPVALAAPSMFSLYGAPPRLDGAAVLAISQSGTSPDIIAVVEEARAQGAPSVAITNDPDSPLAAAADHVLPLEAGPELATAATKTYTTQLLAIAALSAALSGGREASADAAALHAVPRAIAAALGTSEQARGLADARRSMTRAVVVGRGYEYATAREWSLKLQELTYVMAHAWSSADFEHGPLALLERGFPVLAAIPNDEAGAPLVPLLRRFRDDHGADLVTISSRSDIADLQPMAAGAALPPWLAPIASIVPGQLFAYHLARAKGIDTERPRSISKVTRTR
ncbi:MAG TPA: SIS domain-containing protein [Candidatus Dormibacteraeota bacterium]|nr:SIS domain-containing protein [Candidatus Dormibacteraeota bacterium]